MITRFAVTGALLLNVASISFAVSGMPALSLAVSIVTLAALGAVLGSLVGRSFQQQPATVT